MCVGNVATITKLDWTIQTVPRGTGCGSLAYGSGFSFRVSSHWIALLLPVVVVVVAAENQRGQGKSNLCVHFGIAQWREPIFGLLFNFKDISRFKMIESGLQLLQ